MQPQTDTRHTIDLPDFNHVSAGGNATLDLPVGLTYNTIYINYGGNLSDYGEILVKVGGKVVMTFESMVELNQYNVDEGRATAAGTIALDFIRYNMNTKAARELTALATGSQAGVNNVQISVRINAGAASPALSATGDMSAPRGRGSMKWIQRVTITASHVGEKTWPDLPRGPKVNKIRFLNSNIDQVRVMRDQTEIFKRTKALNDMIQNDGVRNTAASRFNLDPTELGDGAAGIDTLTDKGKPIQDLRVILKMSAAGQIPIHLETIALSPA